MFPVGSHLLLKACQWSGPWSLSSVPHSQQTQSSAYSSSQILSLPLSTYPEAVVSLPLLTTAIPQLLCELPCAWAVVRVYKLASQACSPSAPAHPVPHARELTSDNSFGIMSFSHSKPLIQIQMSPPLRPLHCRDHSHSEPQWRRMSIPLSWN